MQDPDLVLAAVVTAFQSIPEVVAAMDGLTDEDGNDTIYGHFFQSGEENSLARSILSMRSPSILVVYLDLLAGNFSGSVRWKHRLEVYLRPKNVAMGTNPVGISTPHLWWLMMNKPITGMTGNIRQVSLLSGALYLPDTPTLVHHQDESTLTDFFCGTLVFPEAGDD